MNKEKEGRKEKRRRNERQKGHKGRKERRNGMKGMKGRNERKEERGIKMNTFRNEIDTFSERIGASCE